MKKSPMLFSRKEIKLNFEKYGHDENVLFITGIFGAGKTYLGKHFAETLGAIHINQDWLGWSECYDCETSKFFLAMFRALYPESIKCYDKQSPHYDNLRIERRKYRPLFDKMIVDYAKENTDKLFVLEGSDLYYHSDISIMIGKPLIIKRTSVFHAMCRMIKRRGKGEGNWWTRFWNIQRLHKRLGLSLRTERKRLNKFIKAITAKK